MQMQADDVISLGLFPQSIRMMFTISSSCLLRERRGRERTMGWMHFYGLISAAYMYFSVHVSGCVLVH